MLLLRDASLRHLCHERGISMQLFVRLEFIAEWRTESERRREDKAALNHYE